MSENRIFNGKLNLDDSPFRIGRADYIDALNITRDSQESGKDEVVSNIVGNQLVSYTLPTGTNKTIGNYPDKVRNRAYIFNWNSAGYHSILYYDATLNTMVKVMENLTNTDNVDVLNFNASWKINHIDIIYRDNEGDLLFWTDGINPPSKINVLTATTGGYGIILRTYIDVIREPPSAQPYCVYEDDLTVTINNLHKKLFKFKYRFIFDDLEKSVTSSQSEVALPFYYTNTDVDSDPTKNADIFLLIQTGSSRVKKIEILGAESIGDAFSDFFLIDVLDKDLSSIPDNDIISYRFYNDKAYSSINIEESIQTFDWVPLTAYGQNLLNGDILDYGNITEGYDLIVPEIYTITPFPDNFISSQKILQTTLLYGAQNGQPAFGTGNIKIVVAGIVGDVTGSPVVGYTYQVYTLVAGVATNFSYTVLVAGITISAILAGLAAAAVLQGFTLITTTDNYIIISKSGATLSKVNILPDVNALSGLEDSIPAYDWNSHYKYGIVYFDEKGRTNSVITSIGGDFTTFKYWEVIGSLGDPVATIPRINFEIDHRPPIWAYYFQIVRTENLSKSKYLYWVTERTEKSTIGGVGKEYAYLSIDSLTTYLLENPSIKGLGYEFIPGDRVRILKLYATDGGTVTTYDDKDYEILDSLNNPIVDGIRLEGQVLKIALPNGLSGSFNFGSAWPNYLIQMYTPALNFSDKQTLYYEFGERYIVGDIGLSTRYHQGMTQNQTPNLSQPAQFTFIKGDAYFRRRIIFKGGKSKFSIDAMTSNAVIAQIPTTLTINTNVNITTYIAQSSIHQQPLNYNLPAVYNNYIIKKTAALGTTVNLNIIGYITVKPTAGNVNSHIRFGLYKIGAGPFPLTPPSIQVPLQLAGIGIASTTQINISITIPAGLDGLDFCISAFNGDILSGELNIVEPNNKLFVGLIDQNFSDYYPSAVNSNGRAFIFDPNAKQTTNPTLVRFGQAFQPGTNINNVNRFYYKNYDEYDRSNGAIKKMFVEGRSQFIFQEFDIGVVSVLTQIVKDTANNPLSAQTDSLINKIVYPYIGKYGIGNVPESFAYGKHAKYFIDNNKGVVCRLSLDGVIPLSILYKCNSFFVSKLSGFKTELNIVIPETGIPTVCGAFDAYTNKYIIALEQINRETLQQEPYTISFLETRNQTEGFEAFLSFHPENMGCLNNLLIVWKNGQTWAHNNSIFCNFFGVQYGAYIKPVFNENVLEKKTFLSITESSSQVWECPEIETQTNSYGDTPQLSKLIPQNFTPLENMFHSALYRDINSRGGWLNGDTLKGNYIIIKFLISDASNLVFLNMVSLHFIDSPLTNK